MVNNYEVMPVIFCISLQDDGSPSYPKKFIRLPPPNEKNPYRLKFIIPAGSKSLNDAKLHTNYPLNKCGSFKREIFYEVNFEYDFINDAFCEFPVFIAGAFEYYVEYYDKEKNQTKSEFGFVLVDPKLLLKPKESHLSKSYVLNMDSICMLTVVPKWMGTINQWNVHLESASLSGYNFVHFVPLQKRGCSDSPYSIYDQLSLSDDLFESAISDNEKYSLLSKQIKCMENDYSLLSATDVVWNHTACNSLWLQDHPEAGYNLENSPHLKPAYELDEALLVFSNNISNYNIDPVIANEQDIDNILKIFKSEIFIKLKLW